MDDKVDMGDSMPVVPSQDDGSQDDWNWSSNSTVSWTSNSTEYDYANWNAGHHGHMMKCCLFGTLAVAMLLVMNLLVCQLRKGVRRTYDIKNESCCEDTAFSCICPHLALAQMMRHTNPNASGCCDCNNRRAVTTAPVATAVLVNNNATPIVALV